MLAAKLSLCVRVDALTEAAESAAAAAGAQGLSARTDEGQAGAGASTGEPTVALSCRRYVENKLMQLEQQQHGAGMKQTSSAHLPQFPISSISISIYLCIFNLSIYMYAIWAISKGNNTCKERHSEKVHRCFTT